MSSFLQGYVEYMRLKPMTYYSLGRITVRKIVTSSL